MLCYYLPLTYLWQLDRRDHRRTILFLQEINFSHKYNLKTAQHANTFIKIQEYQFIMSILKLSPKSKIFFKFTYTNKQYSQFTNIFWVSASRMRADNGRYSMRANKRTKTR